MRHAFSFPFHIREAVRAHVRQAVEQVSPARFEQEPAYIAALLARLDGVAYEQPDGSVIHSHKRQLNRTRGRQGWSGADLAITAAIRGGDLSISKAILAQAKRGRLEDLPPREREVLDAQIRDMRRFTPSPKVILIHELGDRSELSSQVESALPKTYKLRSSLSRDYSVRRILTTLDGDTRPDFVGAVGESSLKQLRVSHACE